MHRRIRVRPQCFRTSGEPFARAANMQKSGRESGEKRKKNPTETTSLNCSILSWWWNTVKSNEKCSLQVLWRSGKLISGLVCPATKRFHFWIVISVIAVVQIITISMWLDADSLNGKSICQMTQICRKWRKLKMPHLKPFMVLRGQWTFSAGRNEQYEKRKRDNLCTGKLIFPWWSDTQQLH